MILIPVSIILRFTFLSQPCSHLTSAFASKLKNGFYGNKCWCSYLTFQFDIKDKRKTQTKMLSVNKTLPLVAIIANYGLLIREWPLFHDALFRCL